MANNITLQDKLYLYGNIPEIAYNLLTSATLRFAPTSNIWDTKYSIYNLEDKDKIVVNFHDKKLIFITPDSLWHAKMIRLLGEIFGMDQYRDLNVKDRVVIDVGATVADTAIYFSARDAAFVESYEPDKTFQPLAAKNIELNNMNGKISYHNQAATSDIIDELAQRYSGKEKVLKLDCEGCEYNIIKSSKRIGEFKEIIMEYHYGYLDLEKQLTDLGFKVEHTRPRMAGAGFKMQMGFIYAIKDKKVS